MRHDRSPLSPSADARHPALVGVVATLVAVGVLAAVMRYALPTTLHRTLTAPLYRSYAAEQLPVLARHPVAEALHRLGGALWMLLGAAQFSRGVRARWPRWHRLAGRVFVALSVVAGGSGAYMALAFPYEPGERVPGALFGGLMVLFVLRGITDARRGRIAAHRAWMVRCFAVGLGIATIRVMAVVALHTTTFTTRQLIAPIFWLGWTLTLAVAEALLRAGVVGASSETTAVDSGGRAAEALSATP